MESGKMSQVLLCEKMVHVTCAPVLRGGGGAAPHRTSLESIFMHAVAEGEE